MTETRSSLVRVVNHSAVMMVAIEALDAWCPPILRPSGSFRAGALAASMIAVESQSTLRSIASHTSMWVAESAERCVVVVISTPLSAVEYIL